MSKEEQRERRGEKGGGREQPGSSSLAFLPKWGRFLENSRQQLTWQKTLFGLLAQTFEFQVQLSETRWITTQG